MIVIRVSLFVEESRESCHDDDDMVDEADKGVDRTIAVCTDPDRWDLLSRVQEHRQQYPSISHASQKHKKSLFLERVSHNKQTLQK